MSDKKDKKNKERADDLQNEKCECEIETGEGRECLSCKELENNWKRALADYKNLEKRVSEEKADFAQYANSVLLLRILPILDNLEMMQKHSEDEGLKMIIKEFKRVLDEESVEEINAEGQKFDPEKMDAIEKVESNEKMEGKAVEVTQKGYMLKNKVLRPAIVKVGRGKEKTYE